MLQFMLVPVVEVEVGAREEAEGLVCACGFLLRDRVGKNLHGCVKGKEGLEPYKGEDAVFPSIALQGLIIGIIIPSYAIY